MSYRSITRGATSQIIQFKAYDTTSVIGAGKTGLTTASFTYAYYNRTLAGSAVAITLDGSMSVGVWKTGGLVEIDATHMPGWYQLGLPDAAVSTGDVSPSLIVVFVPTVAAGAYIGEITIPLTAFDLQDAVRAGLTALPNVNAAASGGLPTLDSNLSILSNVEFRGTASAGASNTITLAGAVATDSFYKYSLVQIISGTGAGQTPRMIIHYVGSTKVATIAGSWTTTPDNTSVFVILPAARGLFAHSGIAQAGASTSITLSTLASTSDNIYNGAVVWIDGGTGIGEQAIITAYNGTTKVATITPAWAVTPDSTSIYHVMSNGRAWADVESILGTASAGAAGYVGTDQSKIANPTAVVDLSGTTIKNVDNAIANVTTVATATNLTNAPTAGDFTATMKTSLNTSTPANIVGSVGSVAGNIGGNILGSMAGSVVGSVGSVAGNVGGNVSGNVTGSVGSVVADVGITQAAADKVWSTTVRTLSVAGVQAIWDALTTALTTPGSIGKRLVDFVTTLVYSAPLTGTQTAQAVLNATAASYDTAGTIGEQINNAGSAGDPWSTAVPGSYPAGTAGYDQGLLPGINARTASGTLVITDGFSSTGALHIVRYATYSADINTLLLLTVSVPTDPTGSDVTWTFNFGSGRPSYPGAVVSYNSSAGTAIFSLALTSTETGDCPIVVNPARYALSAVLDGVNVLQSIPYANGLLYVADAPNPLA